MDAELFEPQTIQVQSMQLMTVEFEAMQLVVENDPRCDNAEEIANWCDGTAYWATADDSKRKVWVEVYGGTWIAKPSDWIVKKEKTFSVMSDNDFQKRYSGKAEKVKKICPYCLADPKKTPQGDPGEKLCPLCSCRYSGSNREDEYNVLVVAGLVSKEE